MKITLAAPPIVVVSIVLVFFAAPVIQVQAPPGQINRPSSALSQYTNLQAADFWGSKPYPVRSYLKLELN